MKKVNWLFISILLVFIIACGSTTTNENSGNRAVVIPPEGNGNVGGGGNPIQDSPQINPQGGIGSSGGNNNSSNINIPSYNESAPNGILEQLAWGGIGGGDPDKQLCGDCSIGINESLITIRNFPPSHNLSLGLYRNTGYDECSYLTADYVMSAEVQVDDNGNLTSTISGATSDLFVGYVTDTNTNEMIWEADYGIYGHIECTQVNNSQGSCQGAPPQRLKVNEMAYVCTASDTVKLREGPDKDYPILKSLVPGADLKIIGGPKCSDNWSWWQVETESGFHGWMSEGGDSTDKYFLCPKQ